MFDFNQWNAPVDDAVRTEVIDALEQGCVIALPQLTFNLLPEEQRFLSIDWADKKSKNISLRPNLYSKLLLAARWIWRS